ncbi:MAG: single-stranded DNA-binding protein [Bacteroidota bacterium]
MGGLNKAMLIGNLGKDPEVKVLDNGAKIATFPLATSETYKDREGIKQTRTEWHNIVLWRGLADVAELYCRKGGQIYIEGRLSTRKWDDKDGHTRYTTEIIGDQMVLLSRADVQGSTTGSSAPPSEPSSDLPY